MRDYFSGDTIKLECEFKEYDGVEMHPDLVKLRIYDRKYNLIEEIINIPFDSEKGVYFHYYTLPSDDNVIIYEWYAEEGGMPTLIRKKVNFSFLSSGR